jgi:Lar family restriction alleviation protein
MWTLPRSVLPCPFCGGTEVLALDLGGTAGVLQCRTCNAQGPPGQTHDLTVEAWETRGTPLPRACRRCGTVYLPHTLRQQYCGPVCRGAAARELRVARERAWREAHQRVARQQAAAQRREARMAEREVRREELAAWQWFLASS